MNALLDWPVAGVTNAIWHNFRDLVLEGVAAVPWIRFGCRGCC